MTVFRLGLDPLTPETLFATASDPGSRLQIEGEVRTRMTNGVDALTKALSEGTPIYGVNTGFGLNATEAIHAPDLQLRLARYLDVGSGPPAPFTVARGAILARAHVLAKGYSAVRPELLDELAAWFASGVGPWIPTRGSLGASGDLVSMAPLARLLAGEPVPAMTANGPIESSEALRRPPFRLEGREALALVNGLSGAAAWIAISLVETERLLDWAVAGVAAASWALGTRLECWSEALHTPPISHHAGAATLSARLRARLAGAPKVPSPPPHPIQDPYSLRCAPQLLGAVQAAIDVARSRVHDELETVSDNPIFVDGAPISGGNFFGGALVQGADTLKGALARVGDLLERQTFLLVGGSRGLPENLVPASAAPLTHGLKGVHQVATALAMALQEGAIPSAPFARSAEGHNQDIVSNAMNGAASLARQLEVARELVAAHMVLAVQAVTLRAPDQPAPTTPMGRWHTCIDAQLPPLDADVALRPALAALTRMLSEPAPS